MFTFLTIILYIFPGHCNTSSYVKHEIKPVSGSYIKYYCPRTSVVVKHCPATAYKSIRHNASKC